MKNIYLLPLLLLLLFYTPFEASADDQKLIIGTTPWDSPENLQKMFAPLMEHLSKTLEKKTVFRVSRTYEELSLRIQDQTIDIGFFSPLSYVETKKKIPSLKYILTLLKKDETGTVRDHYKGVIISLYTSPFNSLLDLKGKKFAFTSYQSTSGYLYPNALLKTRGIVPASYFSEVFMLKKHENIIAALIHHSIDAGATWDESLTSAIRRHGNIFKVLAETNPIPLDAYAAGPHVSDQLCDAIRKALLLIKSDSPLLRKMQNLGFPFDGFSLRNDEFYNVVREIQ